MRSASLQTFALAVTFIALGCSDGGSSDQPGGGSGGTSASGTGGRGGTGGTGAGATGGTSTSAGGSAGVGGTQSSAGSANAGGTGSGSGNGGTGSGGTGNAACTNVRPTGTEWDEATCDQWASETSECSEPWMVDNDYCNESCGRCTGGGSGGTTGTGGTGSTNQEECVGTPLSGGTQHCSSNQGNLSNGVSYSVWLSNSTSGTNCGTFYGVDSAFKASWNMPSDGDLLVRAGLQWNKTQTHEQLGTISADFAYTKIDVTDTKGYIGIYGWSSGPLVEYYIVEEWLGWNPASNAEKQGTYTADGGTYDLYTHTQVNQPSIEGTTTFPQYFGIRQSPRQCGHISISEHFKQWSMLGQNLGKMYEAKLLVEAMSGSGAIDFTTGKVSVQ